VAAAGAEQAAAGRCGAGCDDGPVQPVRFRHSASAAVAALLGAAGAVPLAFTLWYPLLTPLLLVPVGILAWAVRCGTDAGPAGVRVRALFASRLLPWSDLDGFAPAGRGVVALTRRGGQVPLPADHPLWTMPNFLLTPHVAGSVRGLLGRAYELVGDQVRRYAAGQPLLNLVRDGY